ncbi:NADP-dependent oxidoreductase [Burkholderia gladioli]|uniref:NADP-dependent oxidoreductase n=1 Tax=Burkholderia gladioli TaxID=28095 RepID=UPI00163F6887|nr:NADP-dependent oxidoreductase [Burkholderia gladioli]
MTAMNRRIVLASRPRQAPEVGNFRLEAVPLVQPGEDQVLVRQHYLSLDPYMRDRMSVSKSYAAPQPLDEVMIGGTVGEVLASRNARFKPGDFVAGMGGWQEYALLDGTELGGWRHVDPARAPLSAYLGAIGMPGVTAWYGLARIIAPQAGETVVISSAAGAVGGAAGQLARARGARVIGIAGGPRKCAYVVEELGFDACLDHRQYGDLKSMSAALNRACPNGIDGYFENVGGMLLDAVLMRCNPFARVALCGMIAGYNGQAIPLTMPQLLLINRIRLEGFIIADQGDAWFDALEELGALVGAGKLRYHESVADGLARAPEAFITLLGGGNHGKQVVKLVA